MDICQFKQIFIVREKSYKYRQFKILHREKKILHRVCEKIDMNVSKCANNGMNCYIRKN